MQRHPDTPPAAGQVTMTTKAVLTSKDVNAPVATVRPIPVSKLQMPSKLRPPQVKVKRPLSVDERGDDNTSVPQPKRKRSDEATKPPAGAYGATAKRPNAGKLQRPPVARPTTGTEVNMAYAGGAKPAAAKPGKPSLKKTSKRPAWDLRGRLADIESQLERQNVANNQLLQEVSTKSGDNHTLKADNSQLRAALDRKDGHLAEANRKIQQLERQVRDVEGDLVASTQCLQREKDDLLHSNSQLERQLGDVRGDLDASRQECSGIKASIAQMTAAQAGISAKLAGTKLNLEQSLEENAQLKAIIAGLEATIADQESQIRDNETTRRKLHNTIQELKGNIRVFCRVRPLLAEEATSGNNMRHISFAGGDKSIELTDASLHEGSVGTRSNSSKKFEFAFDRVFDPASLQTEVFEEISQLVQSALDGYNVCIFAYGQTGSGKTFTMEGPVNVEEKTRGMIPRAVRQIFKTAGQLKEKGWDYSMEASFLEIYNETVRDLLGNSSNASKKCEIKMVDAKGMDVEVTNSTTVQVTAEKQVQALLTQASHNRAVAATNCNERSSRSHSIFRLKLSGSNELTGESSQGTLNLVDLAGSERLSQSGSTGDRLRETKNINRSLSNLGNVIMALANKDPHVAFRNSKLTHLLQNSLGGNSKTLMFVNISPREENFQESLCSLRFATKVNQCNIGTAQKKLK